MRPHGALLVVCPLRCGHSFWFLVRLPPVHAVRVGRRVYVLHTRLVRLSKWVYPFWSVVDAPHLRAVGPASCALPSVQVGWPGASGTSFRSRRRDAPSTFRHGLRSWPRNFLPSYSEVPRRTLVVVFRVLVRRPVTVPLGYPRSPGVGMIGVRQLVWAPSQLTSVHHLAWFARHSVGLRKVTFGMLLGLVSVGACAIVRVRLRGRHSASVVCSAPRHSVSTVCSEAPSVTARRIGMLNGGLGLRPWPRPREALR